MNPLCSLSPGVMSFASTPATNQIMVVQIMPILSLLKKVT